MLEQAKDGNKKKNESVALVIPGNIHLQIDRNRSVRVMTERQVTLALSNMLKGMNMSPYG